MKQVVETYGKALLEAAVVILLMVLLFAGIEDGQGNRGIFRIIGNRIQTEHTDDRDYTDFNIYRAESIKAAPSIRYQASELLHTGINNMSACIQAVDYEGRELPFEVRNIFSPDGEDITAAYNLGTMDVYFPEAGIYVVKVAAGDDIKKEFVCTVRLPVNR